MKTTIYNTFQSHGFNKPYLLVQAGQQTPLPAHPDGKNWTIWKDAELAAGVIGIDPKEAASIIQKEGFLIIK
jgi:hypothetical protein